MAENTKPAAHAAKEDTSDEPHDYVKDLNKEIIKTARDRLKEAAEKLDSTNGPSDTLTGSTAKSAADLLGQTPDVYARVIPPGPDDPYIDEK